MRQHPIHSAYKFYQLFVMTHVTIIWYPTYLLIVTQPLIHLAAVCHTSLHRRRMYYISLAAVNLHTVN